MLFEIERAVPTLSWLSDIFVCKTKSANYLELITNLNTGDSVHYPRIGTKFKGHQQLFTFQYFHLLLFLLSILKE